ncbi:sensor histidine kinase [Pseudomonas sp. UL073]|uniref:histidine kinase n=1 Tax=Zestomonas insulae TaxID=2809017 RepID=A0ABS2IH70_9GAMM|nr:ATP-binding protein [Pseudomonas insulae]MBM7062410.1 sensor histidine kinase [Pseudomonas insulae]
MSGFDPSTRHGRRRAWWLFGLFAVLLAVLSLWLAGEHGRRQAYDELAERARRDADLNSVVLRTVLEKQRSLPFVLAQDRDIRDALVSRNAAALRRIDQKFESLLAGTRASVIYLLDAGGLAVASSNWREPTSFVGSRYDFRAYYRQAAAEGSAEHYALGSVSKRPGLYISRRVEGPAGMLGVVVVKLEFDDVEHDWQRADDSSYVTDTRGIVLITSRPAWRFMTLAPVAAEQQGAIRESLQFGDASLAPLPIEPRTPQGEPDVVRAQLPGAAAPAEFLRVSTAVPATGWRLNLLVPTAQAVQGAMRESRSLALFGLGLLLGLAAFVLYRRQKAIQRATEQEQARLELERRVIERTQQLSRARDELQEQIDERLKAEASLQSVQQELVQANRLAILGQVAAGVAHEINQPVAAIRSYADNARTFLSRDNGEQAGRNLEQIASLTERIGTITDELRSFSRKGQRAIEPIPLVEVIDGALLLLGSRFRQRYGRIDVVKPAAELRVMGTRIRLEQVLINLLQNALEAVENHPDGRVEVSVSEQEEGVALIVSDNGGGIPEAIMAALFTPFNTSKEGGLGLGLVISKDIIGEFGGRIEVASSVAGTRFTVYLQKAV